MGKDEVKFFCEVCRTHEPVEIDQAKTDELNKTPWGDIVCKTCRFVIATYSHPKPGQLIFMED